MPQREHADRRAQRAEDLDESIPSSPADTKSGLDDDVDAILDEIDEVLEENAEDFVKSFVQKGGQ